MAFIFWSSTKWNALHRSCSRPTALQERTRDSDEDELHDRDYDISGLTNNLSQAFRYNVYGSEDVEEVLITLLQFYLVIAVHSQNTNLMFYFMLLMWILFLYGLQVHGSLERDDEVYYSIL